MIFPHRVAELTLRNGEKFKVEWLLHHNKKSQLRWCGHMIKMPPQCLTEFCPRFNLQTPNMSERILYIPSGLWISNQKLESSTFVRDVCVSVWDCYLTTKNIHSFIHCETVLQSDQRFLFGSCSLCPV